jgi:serine protease Do
MARAFTMLDKMAARPLAALMVLAAGLAPMAPAQELSDYPALPRARYRSGQEVLDAFAPISKATRDSIVEFNVNEDPVALGTVVDGSGLVLTKASEIKPGKLTCWLASGTEAGAQLLAVDTDEDVALVRVNAPGLKPIQWATNKVMEGQWAITPALSDTPQAVGIISALPHRIRPQKALMGIEFKFGASLPTIGALMPGYGAEKAGLHPGDIIAAVDGAAVTNREQIINLLREKRDGQIVELRIRREGLDFDTGVRLKAPKPGELEFDSDGDERENRLSGDVSVRTQGFDRVIEHDTVLKPWQCGGPLVNLDGQAIGLNIARASRVATYALPAAVVEQLLAKLKAQPASGAAAPK